MTAVSACPLLERNLQWPSPHMADSARSAAGLFDAAAPAQAGSPRRCAGSAGVALVAGVALLGTACGHVLTFPGTNIPATDDNRAILETVDLYRQRLLQKNIDGVLVLASPRYFEDSGTPRADDDYGYDGLRQVLEKQLVRVKSMRYDIEYRKLTITGNRAEVEAYLNGSFELESPSGDRYRRLSDYHRFVLERDGERWKFIAGM